MPHYDAITLFRRLGFNVQSLSTQDFKIAYHQLARRYHPDRNPRGHELMANINVARDSILKSGSLLEGVIQSR
jgi:DnaJ-class molecular chaperone